MNDGTVWDNCGLNMLKLQWDIFIISSGNFFYKSYQGYKSHGWYSPMLFFNFVIKESNQFKAPKFTIILYVVKVEYHANAKFENPYHNSEKNSMYWSKVNVSNNGKKKYLATLDLKKNAI